MRPWQYTGAWRGTPGLLMAIFVVALLPLADNYAVHHPDEQYYTGGAIAMRRAGDYLTPRDAEGNPRFNKPILTYWPLAASYRLFGISPLTSRVPFLLVGCAVLALTYSLTRMLFDDDRVARLAMTILLSHPQMVLASLRSMTDIILTLCILLSAYGFLAIIIKGRRSAGVYIAAYGGAGLGVATKGLLPALFVVYVFTFAFLDRRVPLRRLIHVPAMLLGVVAAVGWFVLMYVFYGWHVLDAFGRDQLGGRFAAGAIQPLYLVPAFLLGYLVTFLPWSVSAIRLLHTDTVGRCAETIERRSLRRFVVGWALLLAAVFGCAREPEEHYVLPAIPLLAVLLADVLGHGDAVLRDRYIRRATIGALVGVLLIGIFLAVVDLQIGASAAARTVIVLAGAATATIGLAVRGRGWLAHATGLSLAVLAVFPLLLLAMQPIALPDQGEQLAQRLHELGVGDERPLLFIGKFGTAGKIRVSAAGHLRLHQIEHFDPREVADHEIVILPATDVGRLDRDQFDIHPGSRGYRSMNPWEALAAIAKGELAVFLNGCRTELMIAVRRTTTHP